MPTHRNGGVFPYTKLQFASEDARRLLVNNHIADIDAVYKRGTAMPLRHVGRCVWDTVLEDEQGKPTRVFVKMDWGLRRLWPRLTDFKTGQMFQTHPEREWHGLKRLRSLGLNVPERLALFHEGLVTIRSAIIVREVPVQLSLHDLICRGDWDRLTPAQQDALFDQVVATMHSIRRAGLEWRGLASGHLYPEMDPNGKWSLWLIDCEGVHRRASGRSLDRNFNKLRNSLKISGADARTLDRLDQRIRRAA